MLVLERTIPSKLHAIISFLQYFKEEYLANLSVPAATKDKIEYSIMEAVDNAHEHGNKGSAAKNITIRCWHESDRYIYSVEDEGSGFNGQIPETIPPLSVERGRGLYSIREYTDSVSFNTTGNIVTFTIHLRRAKCQRS